MSREIKDDLAILLRVLLCLVLIADLPYSANSMEEVTSFKVSKARSMLTNGFQSSINALKETLSAWWNSDGQKNAGRPGVDTMPRILACKENMFDFVGDYFFPALAKVWGFGVIIRRDELGKASIWRQYLSPEQPILSPRLRCYLAFCHVYGNHWTFLKPVKEGTATADVHPFADYDLTDILDMFDVALRGVGARAFAPDNAKRPVNCDWLTDEAEKAWKTHCRESYEDCAELGAFDIRHVSTAGEQSRSVRPFVTDEATDIREISRGFLSSSTSKDQVTRSEVPESGGPDDCDSATSGDSDSDSPGHDGFGAADSDGPDDDDSDGSDDSDPDPDGPGNDDSEGSDASDVDGSGGSDSDDSSSSESGDSSVSKDAQKGKGPASGDKISRKRPRRERPNRQGVAGGNLSPIGCIRRDSDEFNALDETLKVRMSWILGYFPEEDAVLQYYVRTTCKVVCICCTKKLRNRSDAIKGHLMTTRHETAQGGRARTKPVDVPGSCLAPSDVRITITTREAAALCTCVGVNASQVEELIDIFRNVTVTGKPVSRRAVPACNLEALAELDKKVKDALAPDGARAYLVVDGSSTSLAGSKKVILIALITHEKTFLLDPTLRDNSLRAEDYAATIKAALAKYNLDGATTKKKIVGIFTDGWSGNAKIAKELNLKQGLCQSHRFDLVVKKLHKNLGLGKLPTIFNSLMNLIPLREAFRAHGLSPSKYETQDHRFKYLAQLFKDLEANRETVLRVLRKYKMDKESEKKGGDTATTMENADSCLAGRKRKAEEAPEGEPPAKRGKNCDGSVAKNGNFRRSEARADDHKGIDYIINFLSNTDQREERTEDGMRSMRALGRVRLRQYNRIMSHVSRIIDASEAEPDNAPPSFSGLVDKFLTYLHVIKQGLGTEVGIAAAEAGVELDGDEHYYVTREDEELNLPSIYLREEDHLVASLEGALEALEKKLPQRAYSSERDHFTYELAKLRDQADPRNGAPSLDAIRGMFTHLGIQFGDEHRTEALNYRSVLGGMLRKLSDEARLQLKPVTTVRRYEKHYPLIVPVLLTILAAPVTVASVERAFSMLHLMASGKRRNKLSVCSTAAELRLRFHRDDVRKVPTAKRGKDSVLHVVQQWRVDNPPPPGPSLVICPRPKPVVVPTLLRGQTLMDKYLTPVSSRGRASVGRRPASQNNDTAAGSASGRQST